MESNNFNKLNKDLIFQELSETKKELDSIETRFIEIGKKYFNNDKLSLDDLRRLYVEELLSRMIPGLDKETIKNTIDNLSLEEKRILETTYNLDSPFHIKK